MNADVALIHADFFLHICFDYFLCEKNFALLTPQYFNEITIKSKKIKQIRVNSSINSNNSCKNHANTEGVKKNISPHNRTKYFEKNYQPNQLKRAINYQLSSTAPSRPKSNSLFIENKIRFI